MGEHSWARRSPGLHPSKCHPPSDPSPALAQDIARRILGEDVTQIEYYTERVKRMVGRVLTGNGITRYGDGLYSLIGADELSDSEQSAAGTSPPAARSPAPGNPGGSWWVSLAVDDAGFAAQLFVCRSISERTVSPRGGRSRATVSQTCSRFTRR